MKNYQYITIVASIAFLSACTADKSAHLADLKAKKIDLEKQLAETDKEIKSLEKATGTQKTYVVKTASVEISEIQPILFQHAIEVQGKVSSDENLTVSPRTAGQITKIYVVRGQVVKKGTLLASIDQTALIKQREALKTNLSLLNDLYEKQKSLWEQNIGTEVQYLSAKTQKESTEKQLQALNEQISWGTIKSTIDGQVEEVYPKEGENTAPGQPMFRLVGNGKLKISADISEAYAHSIKIGNKAHLSIQNVPGVFNTQVKSVGDEIHPLNRTFNVEFGLPSGIPATKANMMAKISIVDYEKTKAITVPISVVQKTESGSFVFVVENKKASKRSVQTGKTSGGLVEILNGLQAGDQIITTGFLDVMQDQPVQF